MYEFRVHARMERKLVLLKCKYGRECNSILENVTDRTLRSLSLERSQRTACITISGKAASDETT